MINAEELMICKRRGHAVGGLVSQHWKQCQWCGTWVREVRTIQEREEDPPEEDLDPMIKLRRHTGE